ncbi:MAG: hypothetical protein WC584_00520 [Candidatus Pacearchaeota archaeon]
MENKFRLEDVEEGVLGEQEINGVYQFKNRRELNDDRTFSPCTRNENPCPIVCRCADTCVCEDHGVNKSQNHKSPTGCLLLLGGIVGAGYEIYKLIRY